MEDKYQGQLSGALGCQDMTRPTILHFERERVCRNTSDGPLLEFENRNLERLETTCVQRSCKTWGVPASLVELSGLHVAHLLLEWSDGAARTIWRGTRSTAYPERG